MAEIRDTGYSRWEGRLVESRRPWWPIARTGVQLAFRRKRFKFVFASSFSWAFALLGGIYISERLEDFQAIVRSQQAFLNIGPSYFHLYLTFGLFLFALLLVLAYAGSGLIADDLRLNALQLYFSRPIRKIDYVLGKFAVLAFFVLVLTALPGLVLFAFKLIFAGSFRFLVENPWLPLSILGGSGLLTIVLSAYVLLLSALSRNSRYVFVLVFGAYLFSGILHGILWVIFRAPAAALVSLPANIQQAASAIFGTKPPYPFDPVWSFVILGALCVLAAVVLDRRIRSVEVIA